MIKTCLVTAAILALTMGCSDSSGDDLQIPDGGDQDGDIDGGLVLDGTSPSETSTEGDAACAATSQKVELAPLDIVLALDNSFSMDFDGKWPAVKTAVDSFVKDPSFAGLGFGIAFYPSRKACNSSEYATPAVPIDILPSGVPAVVAALDARKMSGGTPLVPVLQGVGAYAKDWAGKHADRKVVILLASDGVPDDTCLSPGEGGLNNTLANAVVVTKGLHDGTPQVSTFVIGVGSSLKDLDQIASAGGTGTAILVDTGGDITSAFLDALDKIRKTAIACEFAIPMSSTELDLDKVNVRFTHGDGTTESYPYVGKKEDCALAKNGWYFDDVTKPTKVLLCDGACDQVKSSRDGRVDVLFGCKRIDVVR